MRTRQIDLDITTARTEVPALVGVRRPDLLLLNDGDHTYAKIRLDEASLATVINRVGALTDPLARALVWSAAWDMCRDGEMTARDYVTMVLAGIDTETLTSTVAALLAQCTQAIDRYAEPNWRADGRAVVAAHAHRRLAALRPGDDGLILWARTLADCADSVEDLDFLAGLLDGSVVVDGLAVEGDLRWHLVIALAAAGRRSAADIDAELANDDTVVGSTAAAEARAAIPTAEAKAAAWQLITDNTASAPIQIATANGFAHAGQAHLRAPYVADYFASVNDYIERSERLSKTLIILLFPNEEISVEALDRVDTFLAESTLTPTVRRLVAEGRDSVARALRAREAAAATV